MWQESSAPGQMSLQIKKEGDWPGAHSDAARWGPAAGLLGYANSVGLTSLRAPLSPRPHLLLGPAVDGARETLSPLLPVDHVTDCRNVAQSRKCPTPWEAQTGFSRVQGPIQQVLLEKAFKWA